MRVFGQSLLARRAWGDFILYCSYRRQLLLIRLILRWLGFAWAPVNLNSGYNLRWTKVAMWRWGSIGCGSTHRLGEIVRMLLKASWPLWSFTPCRKRSRVLFNDSWFINWSILRVHIHWGSSRGVWREGCYDRYCSGGHCTSGLLRSELNICGSWASFLKQACHSRWSRTWWWRIKVPTWPRRHSGGWGFVLEVRSTSFYRSSWLRRASKTWPQISWRLATGWVTGRDT